MGAAGIEGGKSSARVREDPPVSDGDAGSVMVARAPSRTDAVASFATPLEAAIRGDDVARALELVEELRALTEAAGRTLLLAAK